jgi:hypothetical protein
MARFANSLIYLCAFYALAKIQRRAGGGIDRPGRSTPPLCILSDSFNLWALTLRDDVLRPSMLAMASAGSLPANSLILAVSLSVQGRIIPDMVTTSINVAIPVSNKLTKNEKLMTD